MMLNEKMKWSTRSAIGLGLPLLVLCFVFGQDAQSRCLNVIILIVGLLLGWVIGILATPYTSEEQKEFTAHTKAISAFASGFIIAKADKAIEHVFAPTTLADPVALFRIALFAAAFLVALIITFIYRKYA